MIRSCLLTMSLLSSAALATEQGRFAVGTQLGLLGGVPVAGAEVVMPVDDDLLMSYAFVEGRTNLADDIPVKDLTVVTSADFEASEASVTFRWFASETFYVGAGAGYRTLDLDIRGFDWSEPSRFDGQFKSQALQAKVLIGNSWTFANDLYLAVDWIGIGAPLVVTEAALSATESRMDNSQRLYFSEENDDDYRRTADKLSRQPMGTVLTLRFGLNF